MNTNNAQPDHSECDWADQRIEACVDGELTADERLLLKIHADRCDPCARSLAASRRMKRALGALPTLPCPDSVVSAVDRAIDAERVAAQPTPETRRGWTSLAVAASVALLWLAASVPRSPIELAEGEVLEASEAQLTELGRSLREKAGLDTLNDAVAQPAQSVVTSLRESGLGRWGARVAALLPESDPAADAT